MRKLPDCDCKYGAPMGRAEKHLPVADAKDLGGKFHLQRVYLDSGGYDSGGAYWGLRPWVKHTRADGVTVDALQMLHWYYLESKDKQRLLISGFVDAVSRDQAKEIIRERYPNAEFFR